MSTTVKEIIRDLAIGTAVALVVIHFVRPTIVEGISMEPSLQEHNYIFIERQAYKSDIPDRGDIVVLESQIKNDNGKGTKKLIKRVIGLPGEEITVRDNKVFVDGNELYEEYIYEQGNCPGDIDVTVPEGCVFVMGDNRANSLDSRFPEVGCVEIDDIMGKAFFRLYPFDEIGRV